MFGDIGKALRQPRGSSHRPVPRVSVSSLVYEPERGREAAVAVRDPQVEAPELSQGRHKRCRFRCSYLRKQTAPAGP